MRPRMAGPPSKDQLAAMVEGLESLLATLPPPPLDGPPAHLADNFAGSFVHDWRQLDTRNHIHERVRDAC